MHKNKRYMLGMEHSLTEVGNPPPHNLVKLHGLVANEKQEHQQYLSERDIILVFCYDTIYGLPYIHTHLIGYQYPWYGFK